MARRNAIGRLGARGVPWAVLALSLATTGVLYGSIVRAGANRRAGEIKREVARLDDAVNDAVRRQVAVLNATAGIVAADPNLTQREFDDFYAHLREGEDARAPEAVGLSLWRPWERRGELAVEAARRGATGYRLRPEGARPEAHAVILLAPLDKLNAVAPGYDMHADPVRARTMDAARASGEAVMTPKVSLAKDPVGHRPPSFILYLPLKDPATGRPTALIYSGIHAAKLFRNLFAVGVGEHVGLRLWSGERKPDNLVYESPLGEDPVDRRETTFDLGAGTETLSAEVEFSAAFGFPATIRPWVLPIGIALSLLLLALAINLQRAREASERRATEQELMAEAVQLAPDGAEDGSLARLAKATAGVLDVVCRIDLLEEGVLRTVDTRTERNDALVALERDYPRLEFDAILKRALSTGSTQKAEGYETTNQEHRALVERLNVGPVVIVPMRSRGRAVGAMTLTRPKGREPLPSEAVALVETVADRVALAVDNARLYHAAQREIEERTAAEAEVRRLNEDLEEIVTERTRDLEASNHELESFCYSVSHDLRTPLRSLDGFGRALKEDYGGMLDEQAHDYIDRIRAATRRMDELITALLTLSRLTRREIATEEVDVSAAAREVMAGLDHDRKIPFVVQEGLRAHADPRMLNVALENLLGNAIKFSSRIDSPLVEVGGMDGEIFVRDNGAGFDPTYAAKLFQPFERLHSVREFPGHGIGLATVERILRRHGGEVRAEGKPGGGATFYMRFPE